MWDFSVFLATKEPFRRNKAKVSDKSNMVQESIVFERDVYLLTPLANAMRFNSLA